MTYDQLIQELRTHIKSTTFINDFNEPEIEIHNGKIETFIGFLKQKRDNEISNKVTLDSIKDDLHASNDIEIKQKIQKLIKKAQYNCRDYLPKINHLKLGFKKKQLKFKDTSTPNDALIGLEQLAYETKINNLEYKYKRQLKLKSCMGSIEKELKVNNPVMAVKLVHTLKQACALLNKKHKEALDINNNMDELKKLLCTKESNIVVKKVKQLILKENNPY